MISIKIIQKIISNYLSRRYASIAAKKVLLPQTSAVDLGTVPAELMSSFSLVFYQSAEDAVFKALGVE